MKKTKFKMTGNGSGIEEVSESSCLCASVLKKDAGVVEGCFNTETQRLRGTKFKMTEIGLIPEDWEVKRLGELFVFKNGYNTDARNYGRGIPVASVLEALSDHPLTAKQIRGKVDASGKDQDLFSLKRGDLIFTRSSEVLEDVGRSNVYEDDACAMFGGFVIRGRPRTKHDSEFINYLLKDSSHRNRIIAKGAGAQHYNIGQNGLAKVLVSLPPLPEQKKIAEALSDVDELLAAMTTLIEKKRAIKQGAMQELLGIRNEELGMRNCGAGAKKVPRRRLPGFSGEWVEKRLGDCGFCFNGITGKSGNDFGNGGARYITFLNILSNVVVDTSILDMVDIKPEENQNEVRCGDLFFNTSSETPEEVGFCAVLDEDVKSVYLNSFCFGFRLTDDNISGKFLAYWFRAAGGRALMTFLAQGSTRYNLSKDAFREASVCIPPTLAEQKAIAEVLSDMDAEIEALEAKRAKYESIKQGMMQELLTGKIRLEV